MTGPEEVDHMVATIPENATTDELRKVIAFLHKEYRFINHAFGVACKPRSQSIPIYPED